MLNYTCSPAFAELFSASRGVSEWYIFNTTGIDLQGHVQSYRIQLKRLYTLLISPTGSTLVPRQLS